MGLEVECVQLYGKESMKKNNSADLLLRIPKRLHQESLIEEPVVDDMFHRICVISSHKREERPSW